MFLFMISVICVKFSDFTPKTFIKLNIFLIIESSKKVKYNKNLIKSYMTNSLRYLNSFKFFKARMISESSLIEPNSSSWNNYILTEMLNTAISTISKSSSYSILKLGLLLNTLIDYLDISGVSFVSRRMVENISRILRLTDYNIIALLYSNLLLKFTSSQSFFKNKYFDNCFYDWMDRLASIRPNPISSSFNCKKSKYSFTLLITLTLRLPNPINFQFNKLQQFLFQKCIPPSIKIPSKIPGQ
jgi:hypothetical protein